ncbi:MAG: AAA family ATPase [Oligoflexus sp.]
MQDSIDKFLLNPQNYQDPPEQVKLIETHISKVYLCRSEVFKRKKALHLEFLDYHRLDQRYKACQDEVTLNRRLAPQTYLGVLPLYQTATGIAWQADSPENKICEWLVHMQRLPQEHMLDERLRHQRKPDETELANLIQVLCRFYEAVRLPDLALDSWLDDYWQHCHQNELDINLAALSAEEKQSLSAISSRQKDFLFFHRDWFAGRLQKHLICDGHGDLKPEHVCLTKPPAIYDCVEFDRRYRSNDILDEMSFFALECEVLGYPEIGHRVLRGVMDEFDSDLLGLHFYRSYRAMVRAKVEGLKLQTAEPSEVLDKAKIVSTYMQLAARDAQQLDQPRLIMIGGLMGSGKTSLARKLAQRLGAVHLESDRVRQDIFSQHEDTQAAFGQGLYTREQRQRVYLAMAQLSQASLQQGQTVIADASFTLAENRQILQDLAQKLHLRCEFIWCDCPAELAKQRIAQRRSTEQSDSQARPELYDQQGQSMDALSPDEKAYVIDSSQPLQASIHLFQTEVQRRMQADQERRNS